MGPKVPANNGQAVDSNQYKLDKMISIDLIERHLSSVLRVPIVSLLLPIVFILLLLSLRFFRSAKFGVDLLGGLPDRIGCAWIVHLSGLCD